MGEVKISASLIVKNEEAMLEKCLRSIEGVNEVVVVDTGSKDKTVDIAKKFTDKVFSGEEYLWRDDFAFSRNQSLKHCSGDWILIIDADEELEPGGIESIREAIKATDKNAIRINAKAKGGKTVHKSIRVFKNNVGIEWKGAIHNYLNTTDAYDTDINLFYGYSPAHKLDPDRALRILSKVVKENPTCSREKYYLAREYWYRRKYDEALKWYDIYLQTAKWVPEKADAYLIAGRCLHALNRIEEAKDYCLKAIGLNPNFKEALLYFYSLTKNKRWEEFANLADNSQVLFIRV